MSINANAFFILIFITLNVEILTKSKISFYSYLFEFWETSLNNANLNVDYNH